MDPETNPPKPQDNEPIKQATESSEKDTAGLTRRGVLKVAWTVPVILAVNPPVNPGMVLAQSVPHIDRTHGDAPPPPHGDVVPPHGDVPHGDGHTDTHTDVDRILHGDLHIDTDLLGQHADTHSDVPRHSDSHNDTHVDQN